jgi:TatD DNase family protein
MLIDTHCHFNDDRFADDVLPSVERALAADVRQMIVVGCDITGSEQAVQLAESHSPALFAAVGVHPHEAKTWDAAAAARLEAWLNHPRVVALGEIGLDFHYDFSPREAQYAAFRAQMKIARRVGVPVVIHCREAYLETLQVLREEGVDEIGGVMHCWAGTVAQAEQTVALGLALGFGGTLTFKNAQEIRDAAQSVPLTTLLVETDAPYLAPMPYRGKRNEPAYTRLVAEKLAALRGMPFNEIATLTTSNAHNVFPRLIGKN